MAQEVVSPPVFSALRAQRTSEEAGGRVPRAVVTAQGIASVEAAAAERAEVTSDARVSIQMLHEAAGPVEAAAAERANMSGRRNLWRRFPGPEYRGRALVMLSHRAGSAGRRPLYSREEGTASWELPRGKIRFELLRKKVTGNHRSVRNWSGAPSKH